MSREQAARCPLAAAELPLLELHRLCPERSLPELHIASARVNDPVRVAMLHAQSCLKCLPGALCKRGARLAGACRQWRPRPDAA
jgi:hypothetical protein